MRGVGELARVAYLIRGWVVRRKILVGNRPSALGDPRPRLKVDGIERNATAAPRLRSTAQAAVAILVERRMQGGVDDGAAVLILNFLFEANAASAPAAASSSAMGIPTAPAPTMQMPARIGPASSAS
jgi:hypothetical protein